TAGSPAAPARGSCPPRHWPRQRPRSLDSMRAPGWRGPLREWGGVPSPFFDPQPAGRRPFLDAGEIVVSAVTVRPHRQIERGIGLALVLEGADQRFQFAPGL